MLSWNDSKERLLSLFGSGQRESPYTPLMNLKQTNLVVESRRQFENIIATSCELPQKFLKEAFLNGLKPEITEGQAILLYWLIMTERDGAET